MRALLCVLLLTAALRSAAQDAARPASSAAGENARAAVEAAAAEMARLERERARLSLEEKALRLKIIRENPEAAKLHKAILELHRSLAILVDADPGMRALLAKADAIEARMAALAVDAERAARAAAEER